eukprot:4339848-Amphidinium_carterae.1
MALRSKNDKGNHSVSETGAQWLDRPKEDPNEYSAFSFQSSCVPAVHASLEGGVAGEHATSAPTEERRPPVSHWVPTA